MYNTSFFNTTTNFIPTWMEKKKKKKSQNTHKQPIMLIFRCYILQDSKLPEGAIVINTDGPNSNSNSNVFCIQALVPLKIMFFGALFQEKKRLYHSHV